MLRRERIVLIIAALEKLSSGEADYAVFEDRDHRENYVQIGDFRAGRVPYVEVTCRNWGQEGVPVLTPEQVDALAALGFGRVPNPNHSGYFAWYEPGCIAKLIESAFMILGSALDFDLELVRIGTWSKPYSGPPREISAHPDPCGR